MATIESLDLATLTNNPQSIADALLSVLQTNNSSIAQAIAEIEQAKTDALAKKAEVDAIFNQFDITSNADLINNIWSYIMSTEQTVTPRSLGNTDQSYLRVYRFGRKSLFKGLLYYQGHILSDSETFADIPSGGKNIPQTMQVLPIVGNGDDYHVIEIHTDGHMVLREHISAGRGNTDSIIWLDGYWYWNDHDN